MKSLQKIAHHFPGQLTRSPQWGRLLFTVALLTGAALTGSLLAGCTADSPASSGPTPKVLAIESFLADMAQNVAGEQLKVETLMPLGLDPHAFEPTPQDVTKIAESQVLIVNGAGLEGWLQEALDNAGGDRQVIEAAAGLTSRQPLEGEGSDPHFWLDPIHAIRYIENIRDGLIRADPAGKDTYTQNSDAYIARLMELDAWIKAQVAEIPEQKRLIVTNHESFGYFADRYGFQIIGAIVPSVSTGASPSAQQLAQLVEQIRATGASAIFLETGTNPQLAEQVAQETGAKVVTGLYSHSLTPPGGNAPTYIDMMRYNVNAIVRALTQR